MIYHNGATTSERFILGAPHPRATPHQNTLCWGHHTRTSHSGATTPGPLINMPTKPGPLILEPCHQDSSSFIHHTRTSHTGAITPGLLILVITPGPLTLGSPHYNNIQRSR